MPHQDETNRPPLTPRDRAQIKAVREQIQSARMRATQLPETIGKYRICKVLGRGGQGIVYKAEQEHPKRYVALKVIRQGFEDTQQQRRFDGEARLLAYLDHVGIAKIFEAGIERTRRGPLPFFAMELVRGTTITRFAREHRLGTRDRLDVFVRVCDAIRHAHQKGVIHRDLKPGNILVNDAGQPKVLDFGIARTIDSDVSIVSVQTEVAQIAGTMKYMSPEQCLGDAGNLDTRSDVYSLGVVLYELLTGRLPYDFDSRLSIEYPRIIREEAAHRPSSVNKTLRGDLETIVLKALEKDRDRRYASAEALATDIMRHLDGRPIEAKRDHTLYVLWKNVRRHKIAVGIALSFVALLGGALAVSTNLYLQAETAKEDLSRQVYIQRIRLAQNALDENDGPAVRELLADLPEESRGWEWRWLNWLADRSSMTIDIPNSDSGVFCLSPDGQTLAAVRADEVIEIRNSTTGELIGLLQNSQAEKESYRVESLAFSPDGSRLLAGRHDGLIDFCNVATGKRLHRFRRHTAAVHGIQFAPDGVHFASAANDNYIYLWDAVHMKFVREIGHHDQRVISIEFSPDGTRIASCGGDSRIRIWGQSEPGNLEGDWELLKERNTRAPASALAFSSDSRKIASVDDSGAVEIWDLGRNSVSKLGTHGSYARGIAWHPTQDLIVSVGDDLAVRWWNPISGHALLTLDGHDDRIGRCMFDVDDDRLATCDVRGVIKFWDLDLPPTPLELRAHHNHVNTGSFDAAGQRIITAGVDRLLRIWDAATGEETRSINVLHEHVSPILFAMFVESESKIVSADQGGKVATWNAETGALLRDFETSRGKQMFVAAGSPDKRRLVTCDESRTLKVWDTHTERQLLMLPGLPSRTCGVTFAQSGDVIATTGDEGEIQVWDLPAKRRRFNVHGHNGQRTSGVAFAPDGRTLVTGGVDRTIEIRDARTSDLRRILRGHRAAVLSVAFSPDGSRIVSGDQEGTVLFWDVETGERLLRLDGDKEVKGLVFDQGGNRLLEFGQDGLVYLWETEDAPNALRKARRVVRTARDLVEREYREHLLCSAVQTSLASDSTADAAVREAALKLVRVRGDDLWYLNNAAWQIARVRNQAAADYERALQMAKIAADSDPYNSSFLNTLGGAYYRKKQYEGALSALNRSVNLGGGSAEDYAILAATHAHLGNRAEAERCIAEALAHIEPTEPTDPEAVQVFVQEAKMTLACDAEPD